MAKFVEIKPGYYVNVDNIFSIYVNTNVIVKDSNVIKKYTVIIQSNDNPLYKEIGLFETKEEAMCKLEEILDKLK